MKSEIKLYTDSMFIKLALHEALTLKVGHKFKPFNFLEATKTHGRFNDKKHLATCAKNRRNRKSKKRKNR